jgi:hypothetical protein
MRDWNTIIGQYWPKARRGVLLVSRKVPGESVFLFAPDGGVPA